MRWLMPCLTLLLWTPCVLSQENSPVPLQPNELRQLLSQLYELKALRAQVIVYEDFIAREKAQDDRERQNAARALEIEKQATQNALDKAALAEERATLYKQLLDATKKKSGGVGCILKKIFTLGIARCGG